MAGVPYYSFFDYKVLASQFLRRHGFPKGNSLPVDIEVLLDKAGIQIHPVDRMYQDFGVKGAVLKTPVGYAIAIDANHYESESQEFYFRFTLAEELSHILLHEKLIAGISTLDEVLKFHASLNDEDYKWIEQQARSMASQLLLPSQVFDQYVVDWVREHLEEIQATEFFNKDELAAFIAERMYKVLKLSRDVVRHSLKRPPDSAIDRVISVFGQSLIK
jgi:hypothetical protein